MNFQAAEIVSGCLKMQKGIMFSFPIKYIAAFMTTLGLVNAQVQAAQTATTVIANRTQTAQNQENGIINYSQQNHVWQDKLRDLKQGKASQFRILQLGDSHIAGAYFTDTLRQELQQKWGNAGIGWVYPMPVSGQRMPSVDYSGSQWQIINMRRDTAPFPLGGILARSKSKQSLVLNPKDTGEQQITIAMRPIFADSPLKISDARQKNTFAYSLHGNNWQYFTLNALPPIRIQAADNALWEVGAINFENRKSGVIVSALGLNGTQLGHWSKWRKDWENDLVETQADLVILAYGTNEAFNEQINIAQTKKMWQDNINRIRQTLPDAAILIVGAPESLINKDGVCGTRPKRLNEIQKMQQQLAQENRLLYWSWQNAMGGECSMNRWINNKLAQNDGVHFSPQGYQQSAKKFSQALLNLK